MKKKVLSIILALVMVVGMLPFGAITAFAAATVSVEYIDETGSPQIKDCREITADTRSVGSGWYVVNSNIKFPDGAYLSVDGNANIIICDDCELVIMSVEAYFPAIKVNNGKALTVFGQEAGSGRITARGGENCAGISVASASGAGTFTVYGGIVQATGGTGGAGIGGDAGANGGTININGGNVRGLNGKNSSAGIGGGENGICDTVALNGGNVMVEGGVCNVSNITIPDEIQVVDGYTQHIVFRGFSQTQLLDYLAGDGSFSLQPMEPLIPFIDCDEDTGKFVENWTNEYKEISSDDTVWEDEFCVAASTGTVNHSVTVRGDVSLIVLNGCTLTVNGSIYVEDGSSLRIYSQSLENDCGVLKVLGSAGHMAVEGDLILCTGTLSASAGTGASGALSPDTTVSVHNSVFDILCGEEIFSSETERWNNVFGKNKVYVHISDSSKSSAEFRYYDEEKGMFYDRWCTDCTVLDENSTNLSTGWYAVKGTLEIQSIVTNGEVHLILLNDSELKVKNAITIEVDSRLTIYSQPAAKDETEGRLHSRGITIGSSRETSNTSLVINGGTIISERQISGCRANIGGQIIINDGSVTVTSGSKWEAGIGNNSYGHDLALIINGGTLTATGAEEGAGIYATLTVNGGTVNAYGGLNASGIRGTVVMNGGTVNAYGGEQAAGIGGGYEENGGDVTVNGGVLKAVGGNGGAGIGGGKVYARSDIYGARLVCFGGRGGNTRINGGDVTAIGGTDACGIGSGAGISQYLQTDNPTIPYGTIELNGGHITAQSGANCNCIDAQLVNIDSSYYKIDGEDDVSEIQDLKVELANFVKLSFSVKNEAQQVKYIEYDESMSAYVEKTCSEYSQIFEVSDNNWYNGWYVADGPVQIDLRIDVLGDARLILKNGCELKLTRGIIIHPGATLTVYAQSCGDGAGTLVATALKNDGCAGIFNNGTFKVHGGNVIATGDGGSAGIGGQNGETGATDAITIYGGNITATAGENAPRAIGPGAGANVSDSSDIIAVGNNIGLFFDGDNPYYTYREKHLNDKSVSFKAGVLVKNKVAYKKYNAKTNSYENAFCGDYAFVNSKTSTLWRSGWYVMDGVGKFDNRIGAFGDVNLILKNDSELNANAGITVLEGNTLTIYSQFVSGEEQEGRLNVANIGNEPGLGTNETDRFGNINIVGGVITADGGEDAAGIGSMMKLTGGTVNAEGSKAIDSTEIFIPDDFCLVNAESGIKMKDVEWCDYFGNKSQTSFRVKLLSHNEVKYLDTRTDEELKCADYAYVNKYDTEWTDGWYVVKGTKTLDSEINIVGDVNLILTDGSELTVNRIYVENGNSITIYSQSLGDDMGKLSVLSGIVSHSRVSSGKVTVYGGDITATGRASAGIGSGNRATTGDITVYNGKVTATGDSSYPGIGGTGANIRIYDGTVTAEGGESAADGITGGSIEVYLADVASNGRSLAHTHDLVEVSVKEATCTTPGVLIAYYKCSGKFGCRKYYADVEGETEISPERLEAEYMIPANGHNYENGGYVDNGDGTHSRKCAVCGETENTAYAHQFVTYISDGNATCTEDGTKSAKCEFCEKTDTVTDAGTKLGHSFTSGIYYDNGDGTHSQKCERCETTDTVRIDHNCVDGKCEVCEADECVHTDADKNNFCEICSKELYIMRHWDDNEKKLIETFKAIPDDAEIVTNSTYYPEGGKVYVVDVKEEDGGVNRTIMRVTSAAEKPVYLILKDGCRLNVTYVLEVEEEFSKDKNGNWDFRANGICICGQQENTGVLYAENQDFSPCAPIGSSNGRKAGTIIINGGTVIANCTFYVAGRHAAAIGGGGGGAGGDVTINGGFVYAYGNTTGAGIGGNKTGNGGNLTVNGGEVTAIGGPDNVGIGGGGSDCGTFTMNGGIVHATGGEDYAGIGGGKDTTRGSVRINDGTVTAIGGLGAATVGGSENVKVIINDDLHIEAGSSKYSVNTFDSYNNQRFAKVTNEHCENPLRGIITVSGGMKADADVTFTDTENPENVYNGFVDGTNIYYFDDIATGKYFVSVSCEEAVTRTYTVEITDERITQSAELYAEGDVNGDGEINANDYALAVNSALGAQTEVAKDLTETADYQKAVADLDGDGFVDVLDAVLLERKIF